jgi:hypothetical protein
MEVENPSLIKALEKRYSEDERPVPEGIVPSRAQQGIAAAGLEPATPGL